MHNVHQANISVSRLQARSLLFQVLGKTKDAHLPQGSEVRILLAIRTRSSAGLVRTVVDLSTQKINTRRNPPYFE